MTQHGCDSHMEDPLAHLMLSVDGQRASYLALHDLAHEVCDGRGSPPGAVATRSSRSYRALGRHLLAIVAGHPIDPATETPAVLARPRLRRPSAGVRRSRLTDGRTPTWRDWTDGYDPENWLDRSILATRTEIFPWHGLDPQP